VTTTGYGPSPAEPVKPSIDYEDHDRTAPLLQAIFGCTAADLPEDAAFGLVADVTRACWDARASLAEAA